MVLGGTSEQNKFRMVPPFLLLCITQYEKFINVNHQLHIRDLSSTNKKDLS